MQKEEVSNQTGSLKRELSERHIRMMALGASIGVGLFLGSAQAIEMAGPAIMLSYLLGGLVILVIMRALGEMAVQTPVAGSFSRYAHDYVGPLAGYLTGWMYWFLWIVACTAEITAVAIYMGYWFPDMPRWLWAFLALTSMGSVNLIAVKVFGEFEFWFALIKIVTIIAMIFGGIGVIAFGLGNEGVALGISNLWTHGGFMPNGIEGVLMSLQMVIFAYLGVEMIGLTAGEAKNPEKTIPDAINSVFWRIVIFYVGALFVILSIYPWNQLGTQGSPFVMTFERLGIKTAAGIINFVVITAALSSCNSGIFSTGRMLFSMAQKGHVSKCFARVSRGGVPHIALLSTMLVLLLGVFLNYLIPEEVFEVVASVATFAGVWTWAMILLAQLKFRRSLTPDQVEKLGYRMWLWPYSSYLALIFLAFVIFLLAYFEETRVALYVGPAFVIGLSMIYMVYLREPKDSQVRELDSAGIEENQS